MPDAPIATAPPPAPAPAATASGASETIQTLVLAQLRSDDLSVAMNVKQEYLVITRDKVELVIRDFRDAITKNGIGFPAGILIAVVTTLVTADFKDIFGVAQDTWRALYLLIAIGCAIWLGVLGVIVFQTRENRDIKTVIKRLKGST